MAAELASGDLVEAVGSVEPTADGRAVVVVGDPADVVVAGQATDRSLRSVPGVPADSTSAEASTAEGATAPPDAEQPPSHEGAAPIAPLMGAAGAGLLLTGILAVVAGWRRRLARHAASMEATRRLTELLSAAPSPSVDS
jgi:hypothetical protein